MTENQSTLPGYLRTIAAALPGLTEIEYREIEEIMRHTIFHSTLDWQTKAQLRRAAKQARQVQLALAKNPGPEAST